MTALTIPADNLVYGDFPVISQGITLQQSARKYLRGDALGRIDMAVPTTGTPGGGNTGNGTMANVEGRLNTIKGTYTMVCTAIATNGGTFSVTDPNLDELPDAEVGTTYDHPSIKFDILDSTVDYVIGDSYTVVVTVGSKEYKLADKALSDGAEVVRRILNTLEVDAVAAAAVGDGYRTGLFNESKIYFAAGNSIEDHRDAMETKSLFTDLSKE